MKSEIPPVTDEELRQRILTGLAAVAELESRFRQPLERFLVGLCDRSDGRSQEKSVEIAGQILAECFIKAPSLLERWQGPDNLEAFLRTAAKNRLKSWWDSAEKKRMEVNSESPAISLAAAGESDADCEEIHLARGALEAGIRAATAGCAEGLAFLRLKGLHGVDQRALSQCWGHHESQTSRRIKDAMDLIRITASQVAVKSGCELSGEVLRQVLQGNPDILLGTSGGGSAEGDTAPLERLAAGGADQKTKRLAVELMCADPRMLGFFADLLNRQDDSEIVFVKDPELSGTAARISENVRRSLKRLRPAEAAGMITPLMSAAFDDMLSLIGAEGGTLWMLCPGEEKLEAVFNPREPEIAGKRQPLESGIVSLVLATEEPSCVSDLPAHARHSPAIDVVLRKTTRSMIAVPFTPDGTACGVLTAVRLESDQPFGNRETLILQRHAEILASLLTRELTGRIAS